MCRYSRVFVLLLLLLSKKKKTKILSLFLISSQIQYVFSICLAGWPVLTTTTHFDIKYRPRLVFYIVHKWELMMLLMVCTRKDPPWNNNNNNTFAWAFIYYIFIYNELGTTKFNIKQNYLYYIDRSNPLYSVK